MRVEIVVVVDKSGSMANKRSDVVGGFNSFLAEQRKRDDDSSLSLVMFDTGYEVKFSHVPLKYARDLSAEDYVPGGGTALLDAIGKTITTLETATGGLHLGVREAPKPDKVILVIVTDGEENSSRLYTNAAIREMIKAREATGRWETIYLGANQDSFSVASQIGTKMCNTANWNATTSDGLAKAFASASMHTASYRAGLTPEQADAVAWRPDDADQSGSNSTVKLKPGVVTTVPLCPVCGGTPDHTH